jgi:hypothetical protein
MGVCACPLVLVCVRVRAWAAIPRLCVMCSRSRLRSHRARVCVLPRAQSMDADPMAFTITSDKGAAVEGRVLVRCVCHTSRGGWPFALVGAPIASMLTAAGDAWPEFVLVEGYGNVLVLVAPEGMDRAACAWSTAGKGTVVCGMYYGAVWVIGAHVRSLPD